MTPRSPFSRVVPDNARARALSVCHHSVSSVCIRKYGPTFFSSCFVESSGDPVTIRRELSLADGMDLADLSLLGLVFPAGVTVAAEAAEATGAEVGAFTEGIDKKVAKSGSFSSARRKWFIY